MTRWTNLLMTTCCDTLRYLNYSLYNCEIKLPKREQQMLNACFEPVVIVFCCVIIRTTSNVWDVLADTRPSPSRPLSSDSGRLNSVVKINFRRCSIRFEYQPIRQLERVHYGLPVHDLTGPKPCCQTFSFHFPIQYER